MTYSLYRQEEEPEEPFERVSVEEARRLVESGEARLIDVREPDEWESGHAKEAEHAPLQTFLSEPGKYVQPGENVVFVCARGQRSAVAAEMAAAVGVQGAYNLEGGMDAWQERGYPVA
jgi:rhodanese-related sulfurtransferase